MPSPIDSSQTGLYVGGEDIRNEYEFDPGVCVLPVAEDAPASTTALQTWTPVVVLRLHAPYRIRRVKYDVTKQNAPPVIPTPGYDAGKFIFTGGTVGMWAVQNQNFTLWDWTAICEYTYVENCVSRAIDGLVLGSPPWSYLSTEAEVATIPPANATIGAISAAGAEPRMGLTQATRINFISTGSYFYNLPSYFPGVFFSDNLVNGGP